MRFSGIFWDKVVGGEETGVWKLVDLGWGRVGLFLLGIFVFFFIMELGFLFLF